VNDRPLAGAERLVSTGWTRARVPPDLFIKGTNRVVMRGGGQLLLQPDRENRFSHSTRSADHGETWLTLLGRHGNQPGEYLVRLRLGRYPPNSWVRSEVFDLWADPSGGVAAPGRCVSFHGLEELRRKLPEKTSLIPYLRTGSTPTTDLEHWTPW